MTIEERAHEAIRGISQRWGVLPVDMKEDIEITIAIALLDVMKGHNEQCAKVAESRADYCETRSHFTEISLQEQQCAGEAKVIAHKIRALLKPSVVSASTSPSRSDTTTESP